MRKKTPVASKTMRFHCSTLPSHFYLLNHLFVAWDCCMCPCVCFFEIIGLRDIFQTVSNNVFFFSIFDRGSTKFDFQCQMLALPSVLLTAKRSASRRNEKGVKKNRNIQWSLCSGNGQDETDRHLAPPPAPRIVAGVTFTYMHTSTTQKIMCGEDEVFRQDC